MMVEGFIPPGPPSITKSTLSPNVSKIISGSVYSSTMSPGNDALKIGASKVSSIC